MNEKDFGQTYYAILQTIKDGIERNVIESSRSANLNKDQINKVVTAAQASVDTIGGNAFNSLLKSCK